LAPLDQHLEKQHQEKTKVKNINVVEMGKFEMDTWYVALPSVPFPSSPLASLSIPAAVQSLEQAPMLTRVGWVIWPRYYSPYPEPYASCEKLYVCEFTMKYFRKAKSLERHLARLQTRQPPGQSQQNFTAD
jgi:histone acetyltransferase MYST1